MIPRLRSLRNSLIPERYVVRFCKHGTGSIVRATLHDPRLSIQPHMSFGIPTCFGMDENLDSGNFTRFTAFQQLE